jgi:hypothetical protein
MNRDTLARNMAIDLSERVKGGKHDFHVGDAETVVDDILSCSTLDFMGASTRKFYNTRNPNDEHNEKMFTMLVKMEFQDRDVRFQAELNLRKICKVNCSVPYPKNVWSIIDALIQEGKKMLPNSFIRTKVNIDSLTVEAFASVDKKWIDLGLKRDIMRVVGAETEDVFINEVPQSQPIAESQTSMDVVDSQNLS